MNRPDSPLHVLWDDGRIPAKLVSHEGCPDLETAHLWVNEYIRFLVLARDSLQAHPRDSSAQIVPSLPVWSVWRTHILDTRNYIDSCALIFGPNTYLHHVFFPAENNTKTNAFRHAQSELSSGYTRAFGHPPPPDVWVDQGVGWGYPLLGLAPCVRDVPCACHQNSGGEQKKVDVGAVHDAVVARLRGSLALASLSPFLTQDTDANRLSEEDIGPSLEEYARYLALAAAFPGSQLTPSRKVDMVFHAHILDTRQYVADCAVLFGGYLCHTPAYKGAGDAVPPMDKTLALYESAFGPEGAAEWKRQAESCAPECCDTGPTPVHGEVTFPPGLPPVVTWGRDEGAGFAQRLRGNWGRGASTFEASLAALGIPRSLIESTSQAGSNARVWPPDDVSHGSILATYARVRQSAEARRDAQNEGFFTYRNRGGLVCLGGAIPVLVLAVIFTIGIIGSPVMFVVTNAVGLVLSALYVAWLSWRVDKTVRRLETTPSEVASLSRALEQWLQTVA